MKFAGALAVSFVLGLILVSSVTQAQQAPMYRIGVLATANPRSTVFYRAFEQRLRELGYEEGRNIAFEYRDAEGKLERLPALARELVRLNVVAIVVATDPATRAAKEATKTIPILIAGVNYDPVALKYVASLARPGGNVTGVFFLFRELTAKRLELFRELLPAVSRVAVLSDSFTIDQLRTVETGNRSLGFKLQPLSLHSPPDFEDSVRIAVRSNAKALFVLESPLIYRARKEIAELALKQRLPTSFAFREYVDGGGLVSYGVSFPGMFRRIAEYVDISKHVGRVKSARVFSFDHCSSEVSSSRSAPSGGYRDIPRWADRPFSAKSAMRHQGVAVRHTSLRALSAHDVHSASPRTT